MDTVHTAHISNNEKKFFDYFPFSYSIMNELPGLDLCSYETKHFDFSPSRQTPINLNNMV